MGRGVKKIGPQEKKEVSCVPKALVPCENGPEFISLGSPSSHKVGCEVFWNIK